MAKYKILFSSTAEKSLKRIPQKHLVRILDVIQALSLNPYPDGCRKLTGEDNAFRVRYGQYRIIYEIENKRLIVLVLKIGHRKDIYKK